MLEQGIVEKRRSFIINVIYFAIIAGIVWFVLNYALLWVLPFVIGFLGAMVLQRPVSWLQKKTKIPRGLWSAILVIIILSAAFSLLILAGYYGYRELRGWVDWMLHLSPSLPEMVSSISDKISGWLIALPDSISGSLENMTGDLISSGLSMASNSLTDIAKTIISRTPGIVLSFIITIIACCFITAGYPQITGFILRQFSDKHRQIILKSKRLFTENIFKMLRGYIIIMFVTFCELSIGLSLIGVNYSVAIALVVAIFDILPVLGTGGIMIPWAIIELITGNWLRALSLFVVYAIITVIRNIIEPKIIGDQVGIPAIVTLICIYVGLRVFGVFGLFALPILVIILSKLQENGLIHIWK